MDEEFKVCVRCKSEFEGEEEMCEQCIKEKAEEDSEEGVDRNEH